MVGASDVTVTAENNAETCIALASCSGIPSGKSVAAKLGAGSIARGLRATEIGSNTAEILLQQVRHAQGCDGGRASCHQFRDDERTRR